MAKGFYCPTESCENHHEQWSDPDEPPFDSLDALRPHVRHTDDGDHDYDAVDWDALEPFDPFEHDVPEDVRAGNGPHPNNTGEENNDPDDSENEDDMVSHEEYQRQQGTTTTTPESTDTDGDDDGDTETTTTDSGGSWFSSLPISPTTAVLVALGLLALFLLYQIATSGDSDDGQDMAAEMDETSDADEDDEDGPVDRSEVSLVEDEA